MAIQDNAQIRTVSLDEIRKWLAGEALQATPTLGDTRISGNFGVGVDPSSSYMQHVRSSSTTLTSTQRMLFVEHTGAATVASIIAEFATDAADETILLRLSGDSLLTGKTLEISIDANQASTVKAVDITHAIVATSAANRTGSMFSLTADRELTNATGTVADNYDLMSLIRTNHKNAAGGTLTADGSVLRLENIANQELGTLTDAVAVLEIVQDTDSMGPALKIVGGAIRGDQETVTAASPALQTWGHTNLDSNANAIAATLGSPTGTTAAAGQRKTIVMTDATNSSTLSVTNHDTTDPEIFTFNAVDEYLSLEWTGTEWTTIRATATV